MGTDKEGFLEEVILAQSLGEQEGTESDVGGRGSPEASLGTCVVCLKEDLWWPEGVGRTGGAQTLGPAGAVGRPRGGRRDSLLALHGALRGFLAGCFRGSL